MHVPLACPECKSPHGLWEDVEVPAWRGVRVTTSGGAQRTVEQRGEHEADWWAAEAVSIEIHCGECQWEGDRGRLVQIGADGEVVQKVSEEQCGLL